MNRRAYLVVLGALIFTVQLLTAERVRAQAVYQPTPEPVVTADNERWYLEGQPITYAGAFYYPTGPQVFFNRYEMLRSGNYQGIPLYVRPTYDPVSLVYVPLAGGRMHPYERPRTGELAGTAGSTAPSFPGAVATIGTTYSGIEPGIPAAAGPPNFIGVAPEYLPMLGVSPAVPAGEPGTPPGAVPAEPLHPLASAQRPQGLNGVFIEFNDRRWFSAGTPVDLDASRFTRIGNYRGFDVYRLTGDSPERLERIYVVLSGDSPSLLVPYAIRR